ncbi:MAG: precorrin-2 C(20)-methyltransferase, partial [Pseudomonadota bacterium]
HVTPGLRVRHFATAELDDQLHLVAVAEEPATVPNLEVEVVPGVTSITACAAKAHLPLAARNERLTVLPGPLPEDELRSRIDGAESVAIMKVGRHLGKIRAVIEDLGFSEDAVYIERASLPDEKVCPLSQAPEKAPYFSMILLTKGADPWL